ncbi:MAG: hypothetical protein FJX65_17475 [Alphaproteobacteria bacterium]|nr:hypothetical protein [Alphaproteobacteria bacterium]
MTNLLRFFRFLVGGVAPVVLLGVCALSFATPAHAQDWKPADVVDAWINVFSDPAIVIDSVENSAHANSSLQRLIGRIGGGPLVLIIERPTTFQGFSDGSIEVQYGSLRSMAQIFKVNDATTYQRLKRAAGATIDYRADECRAALVGLRGSSPAGGATA